MDDRRFDSLTRSLANVASRRGIVAAAIAGVASRFLPSVPGMAPRSVSAAGGCSKIICDVKCPDTLWFCIARACACGSTPREADEAGTAIIKTNENGEIVAAAAFVAPDRGYIELTIERDCIQQTCTSTMVARADGPPVLTMEATASVAEDDSRPMLRQGIAIEAPGVSLSIAVQIEATSSTITSAVAGQPPIVGAFDPATGQIVGGWICNEAPVPFPSELTSLEPAFQAIAGRSMIGTASKYCPPGSPGPTFPFPPDPAPAILTCDETCDAAGIATAILCCVATGPGCLACLAGAAEATGMCHLGCAALRLFTGGGARIPGIDDSTGQGTPTPRGNSGSTDSGADASGTPDTDSELVGSDSARECTASERRCRDRCIPAAECPVESCCLSPESCACVCPDCGDHGAFDPATCRCACNADARPCAEGCMPIAECPPESCCLSTETCLCTCPDCGANGAFDPATCGCTCGQVACPPNFVLDEAACSCVCGMTECAPNHVWDRDACTCTCVPQECPANHVFDEALCTCVCGLGSCPPNYLFDQASCACNCTAECPPTFVFDEATCSCLCLLEGCPPNLTFTPESCACYCAPPACPPGYVVDQASCTCFCPEVGCPEGQVFDLASCACVGSGAAGAVEGSG